MNCEEALKILASIASILTAIVAVWGYGRYVWSRWRKRIRLEQHLKEQKLKSKGGDRGERSVVDSMAALKMTEADIIDAAFRSPRIKCTVALVPAGAPMRFDIEYVEGSN